jgi:Phosphate-selective porin O and P
MGCALLAIVNRGPRLCILARAIVIQFLGAFQWAEGQVIVKVNDDVNFRLGTLLQSWADWTEDPASEGYSQNFFLRRVRFILLANVARGVSIFYQTDNSRAGNAGTNGSKIVNTGFVTQDAFVEWKIAGDQLMLDGGLFYVPQSRNVLTSNATNLSFDSGTFGQQQTTATQSNSGRDWGFALKGYLAGDRLEYRVGVFSGQREPATPPAAGSRNPFRVAGRVQFHFFDTEKAYTYAGTNRGAKKILVLGGWVDAQGDYKAFGGDVLADIPVGLKDAVTVEVDYLHFDGGTQFQQIVDNVVAPLLPRQAAVFTQAGYYVESIQLQPFLRYERLDFSDDIFKSRDQQRYGGGFNWYVAGQNLKVTAFYERVVPKIRPATAAVKDTDHFGIQLQVFYF